MTGGRVKRIQKYVCNESFCLTYGDGVTDLNIADTIKTHKDSNAAISMTVCKPSGKFGSVELIHKQIWLGLSWRSLTGMETG